MDGVYPSQTETPPIDDPEMWKSLLNLLFWLEWDEEFGWAKSVRAAVVEREQTKRRAA